MKRKTRSAKQSFQQGDVIGRKLRELPEGAQTVIGRKRLVLAHGESGHLHVIEGGGGELIKIGERMLLRLTKTSTLLHEEHKPIRLSPGIWEIGRVTEYDWFSRMERQVTD